MNQRKVRSAEDEGFIVDLSKGFEEEENNDDLINIQLTTNSIQVYYYQICKYSQIIQDRYPKREAIIQLSRYVQEIQTKYSIEESTIAIFFKMLQDIKIEITPDQYCDLYKLSQIFEVQILQKILKRYSHKYSNNIEFIINLMLAHHSKSERDDFSIDDISTEMEECLINNIQECLQNPNFKRLPISIIHRMIDRSGSENISSDMLYEFISESIETRFILFTFLKVKDLSEKNFEDLCNKYLESKETESKIYLNYLSSDIIFIKTLKEEKNQLQNAFNELEENNNFIKKKVQKLEKNNESLKNQITDLENDNKLFKNQITILENDNNSSKDQIIHLKNENMSLQDQITKLENDNKLLQSQIKQSSIEIESYQKQKEKLENSIDQKWVHEYNLLKLIKINDDNCYINIIKRLLSNLKFENEDQKSIFCQNNILEIANGSGTSDLIQHLNSKGIINSKSANISLFLYKVFHHEWFKELRINNFI